MSASMRSTLQTVPESVPADHVTNSKVSAESYIAISEHANARYARVIVPVLVDDETAPHLTTTRLFLFLTYFMVANYRSKPRKYHGCTRL
ncbi:hypothetical protein ANTPLA_LOCUS2701 [Anthophora plagiata]